MGRGFGFTAKQPTWYAEPSAPPRIGLRSNRSQDRTLAASKLPAPKAGHRPVRFATKLTPQPNSRQIKPR